MPEKRTSVPSALAEEIIKTIRLLALSGKKNFRKYLCDPLIFGGWEREKAHNALSSAKGIDKIQEESRNPAYLHTIGPHCKRLVSQALSENLSAIGDTCIFFCEKILEDEQVAASPEALEFIGLLEKPMTEFAHLNQTRSEKLFEDSIRNFSPDELKTAFEPVKLDAHRQKVYLDAEVHRLYSQIVSAAKSNDVMRCRKLLSSYIINFSDSENYNNQEVEKLIDALTKRASGFRENLKDSLAIDLYYSITRGILEANVKKAIQGIRKYAHIFEGDPDVKYYYEIDSLERKLYGIIHSKDLMKELKKGI
ncbi:hypothetical protein CH373_18280 [Leptospira perolatii]|uniref:Uncharacterized protein n=1 Tax=Leptospira perolatii TaxID=2023191 RepID=A0A2M9ZHX7_9LEPT|nr:hypothetical protein [Leptospira perolatii]PJZ68024.1 hypothetical protein CH360_18360 [Leptospira perolatii]PJZ71667.1 hypothetical protein CH373_18280 [Leptospira perolatii]